MRSRFSASEMSSSSASPRVPISENVCSRCPSAKSSQAAANSSLSCSRAAAVAATPGGVELEERVLDEAPRAHRADYRSRRASGSSPGAPRSSMEPAPGGVLGRPPGGYSTGVRIALLSPYSWTYPGGVTRHIEALAAELAAAGHERAHPRAVRPRRRALAAPAPRRAPAAHASWTRASSRSDGPSAWPPTAQCSNMALTPHAIFTHARGAAQRRLRRGAHPRAGRAGARLGRALLDRARAAARRHLPHLLGERAHQRHRRRGARRDGDA